MSTTVNRDVAYLEADDEITTIIGKVRDSDAKIVALVLPKRLAALQSVVNMKLLQRVAHKDKKRVVLITSEAALLPLAGAAGVYVASTLQSQPSIPPTPEMPAETPPPESIPEKTITAPTNDENEVIELDNADSAGEVVGKKESKKSKSEKRFKIPDFNKFRVALFAGGALLILLLIGWYYAAFVMPTADIIIKTETQTLGSEFSAALDPGLKQFNPDKKVLPSTQQELKKTNTVKVAATGQKNNGNKASGTVVLYNCSKEDKLADINRTVDAGTSIKTGNLVYILQEKVTVLPSSYIGDNCQKNNPSESTSVIAQNPGGAYNISEDQNFTVSGYSSMSATNPDQMTGGTDKLVKVVSEQDVSTAKQKLAEQSSAAASNELFKKLEQDGYLGLKESLLSSAPTITQTPKTGDEALEVSVSSAITYTMIGIKKDQLKQLIEKDVSGKIDSKKQVILDDGLGQATLRLVDRQASGAANLLVKTTVVAGPQLDQEDIKKQIAGKKRGETQTILTSQPGVTDVEVNYSPFWVFKTPKNTKKVTITIQSAK